MQDMTVVDGADIRIPAGDQEIPGYRAMPSSGKSFPVVLVVHEIFGVNDHMKDVCRRLAKLGYMAIALDLFIRQGDVSKIRDTQEIFAKVVSKTPDEQVLADLDAAGAWAESTGFADTSRLGIIGFCWGGRIVWLYAAHSDKLKAGAAWYGQLMSRSPRKALDAAPELKAPVIGFYGGKDQSIPLDQVEKMNEVLRESGKDSHIIVYPDAGHAFFADYRPSYRESDAKDSWAHFLEWFRKHGVA